MKCFKLFVRRLVCVHGAASFVPIRCSSTGFAQLRVVVVVLALLSAVAAAAAVAVAVVVQLMGGVL